MIARLNEIANCLRERFPESSVKPLTAAQIKRLKKAYPKMPVHLVRFFEIVGGGCIGKSRYMLYGGFTTPDFIYDKETAAELDGIVLVGDDFAGQHEAYDTRHRWRFGTINENGSFWPDPKRRSIIDFIEDRYCADK